MAETTGSKKMTEHESEPKEENTQDQNTEEEIELGSHDTDSGTDLDSDCGSEYSFNSFLAKSDEDNAINEEDEDESEDECSDDEESSEAASVPNIDTPANKDRLQVMIARYEAMHALDDNAPKKRARTKK